MSGASLNGSKTLSALGEGGLFAPRDEERFRIVRRVLMFGEELPGQGRDYNARIMGWNYHIDVLAAAFARSQLRRLPEMTHAREANRAALTAALAGVPGIRPPIVPEGRTHVCFFYPLLVTPEELGLDPDDVPVEALRDALAEAVHAEGLGIMRWQPRPVPAQTLFQDLRGYGRGCPPGVPGERGDLPPQAGPRAELRLPGPCLWWAASWPGTAAARCSASAWPSTWRCSPGSPSHRGSPRSRRCSRCSRAATPPSTWR
ncbi:DegT/DnrJ/EryC1/StrS family aminotransferase [Streptomyces sp. NPDC053474]|uniref:DegT/DnrJ/EryC1/StrS family aminotransferase n=1 Tax=Streptomyces sp. NPDC053474 TaxID=3365704 RepID=UPI0037D32116